MGHIHYSHICDIFALSPCVVGLALHNVRDIYILQMVLGCSVLLLLVETSEYSGSIAPDFKRRVTYCHGPILHFVSAHSTLLRLLYVSALFHREPKLQRVS